MDSSVAVVLDDMSDDEITALISDPAKIETHEMALEVLGVLEAEIADIQSQVDAAVIESNIRPLSEDRQAWLRRATYAGAMRRNERHRVMQRDKEIRGTKIRQNPPKDPETGRLKQERLKLEAEARRDSRKLELTKANNRTMEIAQQRRELASRQAFQWEFHNRAKEMLSAEDYKRIASAITTGKQA